MVFRIALEIARKTPEIFEGADFLVAFGPKATPTLTA
jgi:hypothetical protein